MVEYLDCLSIANEINEHAKSLTNGFARSFCNHAPRLAVVEINAGNDDQIFLRGIKKTAAEDGIKVGGDIDGSESGILLVGSENYVWNPALDVDGISDESMYDIRCVTEAALTLIDRNGGLKDKIVTVIGRGSIGTNLTGFLTQSKATVCVCHSKTPQDALSRLLSASDIVICASRGAKFGTGALKDGVLVIDIGNGFSASDIDEMEPRRIRITPRKNGIGCITRAILMKRVAVNYNRSF